MANAELIVQLEPSVAADLRQDRIDSGPANAIAEATRAAGHELTPLHPDVHGATLPSEMLSAFVIRAPAGPHLESLAEQLRALPGIRAAYTKSGDQPP